MIERAVVFGPDAGIVGIVTEPDPTDAIPGTPALLMWNVGVQHRVGPYRIHVDFARQLARRGFTSLRFDLSGMGDSEVRQQSQLDHERALMDLREAMAFLEKRKGIRAFVPIGFCSSVDAAHSLSLQDNRVVGVCFLEGYAFRTRGFWMRYPLRLANLHRWRRVFWRIGPRLKRLKRAAEATLSAGHRAPEETVFTRPYPTQAQFGSDVRHLASSGKRLLFVYVGGDTDFNYRGQLAEMAGVESFEGAVEIVYYSDADHTFFRVADRERVVARVCDWVARSFRAAAAETQSAKKAPSRPSAERAG
jgi:hypothetical protein